MSNQTFHSELADWEICVTVISNARSRKVISRATHKPTGKTGICEDEATIFRSRQKAMARALEAA